MTRSLAIVKVGGSLYDLPDLGPRLKAWLKQAPGDDALLVPGGGPAVDVIRDLDRIHHLGEEKAHWLALAMLRVNADFLASLLGGRAIRNWRLIELERTLGVPASVLNPFSFALNDRTNREHALPHRWSVTSDSIAARVAITAGAEHLILLKSVTIPEGMDWEEAAERGFVDEWFARTLRPAGQSLRVRAVNLREWKP
jgi:aspartokinase-like uncharacterized kinase